MLRTMRFVKLIPIVVTAALSAGCGPFGYLKKVAKESSRAVADAEAAGAEENAPYEYWGSVTYLEQSKILMGYSEYERSFDYGERAKQLAEEAKVKAEKRRTGKMVETAEDGAATNADGNASAGDGNASAKNKVNMSIGGGK